MNYELVGYAGALLAGYGYIPQITHLVKEHCAAGISRRAFSIWLLAAILITIHALAIHSMVFTFLGAVQIGATLIILTFSNKYAGNYCPSHLPAVNRQ